jgi:hypothetical protein
MESIDGNHQNHGTNDDNIWFPTPTALLQNDMLFRSPYSPIDAPEVLFRRIEDCQEIMTLGDDPYTPMQLLNNAIRLLLGCGLYQRDFEK